MNKRLCLAGAACSLILTTLLSGCAQYEWQKGGATQADAKRDMSACRAEAAGAFPVLTVPPGLVSPSIADCEAYGNTLAYCTSAAGRYFPGATVDINADKRSDATNRCMHAHGWQMVEVK